MHRVYPMGKTEYEELRKSAGDQVPFGVYAIEKNNYAELRCDQCESMSKLKRLVRGFRSRGYKVYSNGR